MTAVYNSLPTEKQRIWCTCTQKPLKKISMKKQQIWCTYAQNLQPLRKNYLCLKNNLYRNTTNLICRLEPLLMRKKTWEFCLLQVGINPTHKKAFLHQREAKEHTPTQNTYAHTHTQAVFFLNELWFCIIFTHQLQPNTRKIIGKILRNFVKVLLVLRKAWQWKILVNVGSSSSTSSSRWLLQTSPLMCSFKRSSSSSSSSSSPSSSSLRFIYCWWQILLCPIRRINNLLTKRLIKNLMVVLHGVWTWRRIRLLHPHQILLWNL